jgi:hypothetical protein
MRQLEARQLEARQLEARQLEARHLDEIAPAGNETGRWGREGGRCMIPKSGNRFPACAKPFAVLVVWFDASAGEARPEKIMHQQ